MDKLTIWLSLLTAVAMALLIRPRVFAFNRGVALRNLALWLAIFVLLGWIYKAFGPFGTAIEDPVRTPVAEDQDATVGGNGRPVIKLPTSPESAEDSDQFNPPQE